MTLATILVKLRFRENLYPQILRMYELGTFRKVCVCVCVCYVHVYFCVLCVYCVYVCVYCVYVCVYCVYVCVCLRVHVCVCMHAYVCMLCVCPQLHNPFPLSVSTSS